METYYSEIFQCYCEGDEMIKVCKECEKRFRRYIKSLKLDDDMATLKIQRKESDMYEILEREAERLKMSHSGSVLRWK